VQLLYRDGLLDDLDPSCGLALGRVAGVGVDGRLTGVFSFFLFVAFWGLSSGVRKMVCDAMIGIALSAS
jgi:hypothetical protein